jgi:AcrR family transcriptional regulator
VATGPEYRERILDAAEACLMERPFSSRLHAEVAARAGVSRPTVYKHVGDQAAIFRAVMTREAERYIAAVLPELSRPLGLRAHFSHLVGFSVQYFRTSPLIRALLEFDGPRVLEWLWLDSAPVLRDSITLVAPQIREAIPASRHLSIPLEQVMEWGIRLTISLAFMPSPTLDLTAAESIERHVDGFIGLFDPV